MTFPSGLLRLSKTKSTNTYLQELLKTEELPDGFVVITEHQTAGRGLGSNTWESEPGKNLTFSILLRPTFLHAAEQFRLNQALSLAVADAVSDIISPSIVRIKWPNDIYIQHSKVCGMLIQNTVTGSNLEYTIAGIGLNVNQESFLSNAPNPISIRMITGKEMDLQAMFDQLVNHIFIRYKQLSGKQSHQLESDYLDIMYQKGEWKNYVIKGVETKARIEGINTYGQLLLNGEDNKVYTCDLKEVVFR